MALIVLTAALALLFLCQTYSCCCCRKYNHPSPCQRWFSQPANQPASHVPTADVRLVKCKGSRRWHTSTPIEEARRMLNKKKYIYVFFFWEKYHMSTEADGCRSVWDTDWSLSSVEVRKPSEREERRAWWNRRLARWSFWPLMPENLQLGCVLTRLCFFFFCAYLLFGCF